MSPIIYILTIVGIIIIGGLVCFLIGRRAIRRIKNLKLDISKNEEINNKLLEEQKDLTESVRVSRQEYLKTEFKTHELENSINTLESNYNTLCAQVTEKENSLKGLDELYNTQLKNKKEYIDNEAEEFKKKVYDDILKEVEDCRLSAENQKKIISDEYEKEKANFEKILQEYKDKQNSIIKINKEQEEIREKAKFYQLHIKDEDLSDIKALQSVKHHLNHPEILDKLIYKTYYEKAYTDLVGRVIGQKKITGIYKLTNITNDKVYIGQAVDIAERWRQHLKRAVGAEPMTTNKLYPAMKEDGPYNFTWQVVEECKKEDLTAREKYWIEFYEGQGYGYNIKG